MRTKIKKPYILRHISYGFLSNSGYGTKAHIEAIKKHGYCPIHRRSYNIKELSGIESKDQTDFLF